MQYFTKKEQIVILLIVITIILIVGVKLFSEDEIKIISNEENNTDFDVISVDSKEEKLATQDEISNNISNDKSVIMVHISGQVINPGIVILNEGDRIYDAVNKAGGLTKEVDLDKTNLAKRIVDEEKIYIPKIGEVIEETEVSNEEKSINDNKLYNNKININTASIKKLESLPGIGKIKANKIIEYRDNKKFDKVEEIMKVSGIGSKTFSDIKDLITVK